MGVWGGALYLLALFPARDRTALRLTAGRPGDTPVLKHVPLS